MQNFFLFQSQFGFMKSDILTTFCLSLLYLSGSRLGRNDDLLSFF
jgi:hypothetical protein